MDNHKDVTDWFCKELREYLGSVIVQEVIKLLGDRRVIEKEEDNSEGEDLECEKCGQEECLCF